MSKAESYISGVLDGSIPAGPWIIKAFTRHKTDLVTGKSRGLYFDPAAGQFVIDFLQEYCIPSEQKSQIVLTPWQHAVLYVTYGWKRSNGTRRFRRSYLEIAKKNGKTELMAGLTLYHLLADEEESPRVFIAATTGKQADHCFKSAVAMRDKHPDLRKAVHKSGENPTFALSSHNLGRISKMSRDGTAEDGAIVSCAILDELHWWKKDSNLHAVLLYGGRTRKQPMMWETTTAGASAGDTSLCWNEREYGTKVLDSDKTGIVDDELAPWIFCMGDKDDWKNKDNWVKSNPSMGYLFDLETIQKEYDQAQGKPSDLGKFKRYALNIWSSESEEPAIEIERWDECCRVDISTHPDARELRKGSMKELEGRVCFGGVDLAPKNDTSALVLLFPPKTIGDKWRSIEFFWCPKDNVAQRKKRDKVDYDVWAERKFLELTPGNLTDVRYIAETITKICKLYDVKEIAYDESWSSELIRMLEESGFPMQKLVPFPQSHARMNGPCHELVRKVLRQEIAHDRNPVMRWQMGNLRWNTQRATGWVRPAKDRAREKIDGCSSLLMALARATAPENIIKPKKQLWVAQSEGNMPPKPNDLQREFPGVEFD